VTLDEASLGGVGPDADVIRLDDAPQALDRPDSAPRHSWLEDHTATT
jgi:hypothetical protein